ncbi:MAG: hypothetical protein M3Y05_08695 [Gemmatimonadota bacterium]|nr:hypothetical protein [Gemmatimonadota bacterium]
MASGPRFFTFVAALFVARRFGVPLMLVVSNRWDPNEFVESLGGRPDAVHHTLCVRYVGSLAGQTPPHDSLASLEQLLTDETEWIGRIHVQFIGRRGPHGEEAVRAFRFPAVLEIVDHVGKREAISACRTATYCS